jgi:hypothetical protein
MLAVLMTQSICIGFVIRVIRARQLKKMVALVTGYPSPTLRKGSADRMGHQFGISRNWKF